MTKIMKIAALVLLVVSVIYIGMLKFILPQYLTQALPTMENLATTYINGKVHIGNITLSPGLSITAGDISVLNARGEELAQIPSLEVGISPLQGLKGASPLSAVSSIRVNNPVLKLTMNKSDHWNISGLLKPTEEKNTAFKGKVEVNNGHLLVTTPYGTWEGGVQGVVDAANNPDYTLQSDVFLDNETLSLDGHLNADLKGRLHAKTTSLNLANFAALIAHYAPVKSLSGTVEDLDLAWENKDAVSMTGGAQLQKLSGEVVTEDDNIPVVLDGKLNFSGMALQAKGLHALVRGQECLISGGLDLTNTKNPQAEELALNFQKFDVQKVLPSVPVAGALTGNLIVNGTKEEYNLNGEITAPTLTVEGYTFRHVVLPLATNAGKIIVQNASADIGGGKVQLIGEYGIKSQAVAVNIATYNVDLAPFVDASLGSLAVNGTLLLAGKVADNNLKLSSVGDFMTVNWQGTEFNNLALDVDINGQGIKVNNFSAATSQNGVVLGEGTLHKGSVAGKITAVRLPLANFFSLAGQKGEGLLSGSFTLSGSAAAPNAQGAFSVEQLETSGLNLKEAHGFASWQNRVLALKKVEVNMEQGAHLLEGTINLQSNDPVFDLSVTTDNVRIEPLWALFKQKIPVTGNLTNKVTITGPLSQLDVSGQVKAWDGSVNKFLVDGISGNYTYKEGELTLSNFQVQTLTTTLNLDGKMHADGTLDFGLDAKNVHLRRIPALNNYAEVEGMVDFSGALSGNYKAPVFNGALTSNNIVVNKQGFTGIACYLHSEGGLVNKLDGTFQQTAGGDYAANLLVDFNQHLVQGDIDVQKGNIQSLLKVAKEDLDIEGLLTGRIEINKAGRGTGMTVKGNVDAGKVRGIGFNSAEFDLFARRGYWRINNLKAVEEDGGMLLAKGEIDARKEKRTIDLEIGASGANAKLITVAMTHPLNLEGKTDVVAQLKGSLDNPEGNFSLQVSPGSISGVQFDNLYGMATLRDDMFKLEQVLIQRGEYKMSAYGTFPQDLLRRASDRRNPHAKMDLQLNLDNANLAILPSVSPVVESAGGDVDGALTLSGTLEDYYVHGNVKVDAGNIKFKHVKTMLDNIKLNVDFGGKQVNLKELSANTGKRGKIDAHGTFALTDAEKAPYLLDFSAKDVKIESAIFNGLINADGQVQQKYNRPHITSHIKVDDALIDITALPEFGEGDSNLGLNVTLELGPKIHMHNTYFYNLWLAGGIQVMGSTRNPHVEGNIHATKGTISYLSTPFTVSHAELTWPQRGFIPKVSFEANTRFRNYNIKVKANGPLNMNTLSASLTSEPPKSQKEIARMLTLKTEGTGDDDMQSLLDAGLQMAFLSDVEDYIKRTLTLDDFRIYSGNTRSSLGFDLDSLRANTASAEERERYNVLFSKYLTKHIMVGYTTSFDQEYHSVFAEYNFNRHLSLNFSRNEKSENWYGIQYQTSF